MCCGIAELLSEGGLDEIGGEFNSSHVAYGVGTLPCSATRQPKVLLIHWVRTGRAALAHRPHCSRAKAWARRASAPVRRTCRK